MADALIIVDFQNDFARPDGALSVPDGEEIAGRINEHAASDGYDLVVATRDWHPPDHGSFAAQGGPWPVHCVQGTDGAALHPDLDTEPLDALREGFGVRVDPEVVRGVNVAAGDSERALEELRAAGATVA